MPRCTLFELARACERRKKKHKFAASVIRFFPVINSCANVLVEIHCSIHCLLPSFALLLSKSNFSNRRIDESSAIIALRGSTQICIIARFDELHFCKFGKSRHSRVRTRAEFPKKSSSKCEHRHELLPSEFAKRPSSFVPLPNTNLQPVDMFRTASPNTAYPQQAHKTKPSTRLPNIQTRTAPRGAASSPVKLDRQAAPPCTL